MTKVMKLTDRVYEYIQSKLPGKHFSMYDIQFLGVSNKAISSALISMERRSMLIKDGKRINECGKYSPLYRLSENAAKINKEGSKATTAYRRRIAEEEEHMNACGIRLHEVLNSIELRNRRHA